MTIHRIVGEKGLTESEYTGALVLVRQSHRWHVLELDWAVKCGWDLPGWRNGEASGTGVGAPFLYKRRSFEYWIMRWEQLICFKGLPWIMTWLVWCHGSEKQPELPGLPSRGKRHCRSGRQRRSLPAGRRPHSVPGLWGWEGRGSRGGEESCERDGPESVSAEVSGPIPPGQRWPLWWNVILDPEPTQMCVDLRLMWQLEPQTNPQPPPP